MNTEHRCPTMAFALSSRGVENFYGEAIDRIVREGENWLACHQAEYATIIVFCPFCGEKLP